MSQHSSSDTQQNEHQTQSVSRRSILVPSAFSLLLLLNIPHLAHAASSTGSSTSAPSVYSASLLGKYSDPKHPGCGRTIQVSKDKKKLLVSGFDGKPGCITTGSDYIKSWKVDGKFGKSSGAIEVDFSPKGGPKGLKGQYNIHTGTIDW
eukprot:CAMPEP_0182447568 /NCGR_PEP_ID=MMETSP1172-20130603/17541_1 /TAXON_ID=708627 /ORGANISM="Timspurckia oligopyrenoides, Strain CCMP3278" /LENGTH=148 /DNA_ID=CAMNT_0024644055 /DNA_START=247 /DNA_END=690 /DNA_ORIENTATION=+